MAPITQYSIVEYRIGPTGYRVAPTVKHTEYRMAPTAVQSIQNGAYCKAYRMAPTVNHTEYRMASTVKHTEWRLL